MSSASDETEGSSPMSYLWLVAVFAGWILLQVWILPKLGIPTCLSGACRTEQKDAGSPKAP